MPRSRRPKPQVVPYQPQSQADIVAILEETLADARAGKVLGLGMVKVLPGGAVSTGWMHSRCYHRLHSGAMLLLHRLTSEGV
jgi:hypothetical protein